MAYGYNEMSFLYDSSLTTPVGNYKGLDNQDNQDSIYNTVDTKSMTVVYKRSDVRGTTGIKDYLKTTVERPYNDDANPYSKLLIDFNKAEYKAMRIKAADLVYLRNMGVYPMNRMWILRRFADGVVVPNNLNTWSLGNCPQPISTMIGWIKDDGTNDKIFNFSFNEGWTTQTKMIHEVFVEILSNEFGSLIGGGAAKMLMPAPNWSQGLLFGFLQNMGITNYGFDEIPIGDPNVLQEAPIRDGGGGGDSWKYTLKSDIQFDLETEYEQKLIGSVDPGSAMLDIVQNAVRMGTSNVKYILKPGSDLINSLLKANQSSGKDMAAQWLSFAKEFINKLVGAIRELVTTMGTKMSDIYSTDSILNKEESTKPAKVNTFTATGDFIKTTLDALVTTILASTIAKYRWPIQGSVGLMAGINTAPWHLTIGNPYSPILSMANVVVDSVDVEGSGELGYNDMPKRLKFNVKCHVGRNLGGQEIMQMFNNSYFRTYAKDNKKTSQVTGNAGANKDTIGVPSASDSNQKTVNTK